VTGGIDIRETAVVVATPDGTARHRNAIRRLDGDDGGVSALVFTTDSGRFAVGNAAEATGGDEDPAGVLFGGDWESAVYAEATETLLAETGGGPSVGAGVLGYVDYDPGVRGQLSGPRGAFDAVPVDPGMAVCYDVFGVQPDGIGVALGDGVALATLAVAGTPVATATLGYRDRWYDVTDAADVGREGLRAEWARIRYEALLGDLASDLAATAPALDGPVALALGGAAAPTGLTEESARVVGDELRVALGPVTVAEAPDAAPARGALIAAENAGDRPGPVPAFAATGAYVPDLADTGAAADALGATTNRRVATAGPEPARTRSAESGRGAANTTVTAGTQAVAAEDTRHARIASALGRLVERIDAERTTEELGALRGEMEDAVDDLAADLEKLDAATASEAAVADLEAAVREVEANLDELETDVAEVQAVLAGLDAEASLDAPDVSDAVGSVAVDALENDIDAVEEDLSARIGGLWDEIDRVNDQLVDVSASVGELPDLEGDIESTKASVEELREETTEIRQSVADLRESVDSVRENAATAGDVDSVANDLAAVRRDLDRLESAFDEVDRTDPGRVDDLERDLDALRETVVDHARRLDGVERTASDLDDRIESAFRDTLKADALSSLQAEVSRIRTSASDAQEDASAAVKTATGHAESIDSLEEDVDQLRQMVDSIAGSSATRSEMDDSLADLEDRIGALEATRGGTGSLMGGKMLQVLAVGLGSAGLLAAALAFQLEQVPFALGFFVFVVWPAAWLLLSTLDL
jgi:septal ring factor EnvC (AmiA/AmiB activator)